METHRERFLITNTMVCLLKAVEGLKTTVELRNEKQVTGTVIKVDGYMNITMKNVVYETMKGKVCFDDFYVNGRNIRYVHIPDEVDMRKGMDAQIRKRNYAAANLKVNEDIKAAAWQKMTRKEQHRQKQVNKQK